MDCVGVGYDGKRVYCLPRTRRALNHKYNITDPTRQTYRYSDLSVVVLTVSRTNSYEFRLWKYSKRGFAVAVPGLVRKRINPDVFTKSYSMLSGFSKLLFFEVREHHQDIEKFRKYKMRYSEERGFRCTFEDLNKEDLRLTEAELNPQLEVRFVCDVSELSRIIMKVCYWCFRLLLR